MVKCQLVIVIDKEAPDTVPSEAYALVSNGICKKAENHVASIFLQNDVQVIQNEDECPPALASALKDGRVKLIEILPINPFSIMSSEDPQYEVSSNSDESDNSEESVNSDESYNSDESDNSDSELQSSRNSDSSGNSDSEHRRIFFGYWSYVAVSTHFSCNKEVEPEDRLPHYCLNFIPVISRVSQFFFSLNLNIQVTHMEHWSLFQFAIARNNELVVKLLVKSGVDINVKMVDGATPLHLTLFCNRDLIMDYLLLHGADVNAAISGMEREGVSPLHIALDRAALHYTPKLHEIISTLLEKGADVNADSKLGSILNLAVKTRPQLLNCVLHYRPDLNSRANWLAFREALSRNNKEIIDLLLDYGFSLNPVDDSFFEAISVKDIKSVKQFLEDGADVNHYCLNHLSDFYGMRPLHIAAENFQKEIMQLLLDRGADVSAKSSMGTPLFHAVKALDLEAIKFLIANGARVQDNPLILHTAAKVKPPSLVSNEMCGYVSLDRLEYKCPINEGKTSSTVVSVIEILMKNGAGFNPEDDSMKEMLMGHAYLGNLEVVEILLKHNLFKDPEILEAMVRAIIGDSRRTLEFLLKYWGDPVTEKPFGRSLLDVSVEQEAGKDCPDIFPLLLNYNYLNLKLFAASDVFVYFQTDDSDNQYDDSENMYPPSHGCIRHDIIKHVIKIKVANLRNNENDLTYSFPAWVQHNRMDGFQCVCESEIECLKKSTVGNSNISFYNFLDASSAEISHYLRNDTVVNVLKSGRYKKKFPVYSEIIDSQFQKGFYRRSLIKQGVAILNFLFKTSMELPYDVSENILDYLSNQDLLILSNVCKLQRKENSEKPVAQ